MHLDTLLNWSNADVAEVLALGDRIKAEPQNFSESFKNRVLCLIFEKTSTRTRASFEAGVARMGGHAMVLSAGTTQLGKGAALKDEIRCLARYSDAIAARVYSHDSIRTMVEYSRVPVINALCDMFHPCQALADLMTMREKIGELKGRRLVYMGDGNNVCNSLIIACSRVGMNITVSAPQGYDPHEIAVKAGRAAGVLTIERNPQKAAEGADVIYTDTHVSMGQEAEKAKRVADLRPYQVTGRMLGDAYFMHCLPLYVGEEVAAEVPESPKSVIFDQAENRMHVQMAVILKCIGSPDVEKKRAEGG